MEDRCVCCGAIVPEGRMVCSICEASYMESTPKVKEQQGKHLETPKGCDGEMYRKIVGYIAIAIVSIIVGYIFAQSGM